MESLLVRVKVKFDPSMVKEEAPQKLLITLDREAENVNTVGDFQNYLRRQHKSLLSKHALKGGLALFTEDGFLIPDNLKASFALP